MKAAHVVCNYLRTTGLDRNPCRECDGQVQTSYGPGTPGCYALAQETMDVVRNALAANREPPHCSTCSCGMES